MTCSIYQPLEDRDEIRILELLPHCEGEDTPINYNGSNEAFHGKGAGPETQRCWDTGVLGQVTEQPVLDDAARQELFHVDNYPWFERSWIIQETLLSFDRIVICSPFMWSWETFSRLAPTDTTLDVIRISDDYIINKSNMGGWNHVWDGQIGERMSGDMLPMAALEYLVDTRKFKCKLYNDRVYSILSLFNPPLPVLATHDSYTAHIGSHGEGGDEMKFIGASRAMLHVRREAQWSRIGYVPGSNGTPGIIRALGFKIGVVTRISRTRLGGEEHELKQRWDTVMTELDQPVLEKESGEYGSRITHLPFHLAKVASRTIPLLQTMDTDSQYSGSWPAFCLQKRNRDNTPWYRNWIPGGDTEDDEKPRGRFYSSSAAFFQDRPLFACEKEGVIGIGTQDLAVGDEIWYLCGLSVPVCALRRVPKPDRDPDNEDYRGVNEVEATMVGLCFLGVNNDMKAMGPTDEVFPNSGLKLVWIT
ncbi:hypothetical protein E0Z10_g7169 [Xylaria hypoxylon]|uniref:Heterokaryon incompatibility domain-containing protein n=1 Tax=Xylaria hypoxylon TaxID=37992 RepID=A0A4Z0YBH2_9PEZI|nr:hypothetical protein E0Z10_g7169 [Xylaria hypoxylon]